MSDEAVLPSFFEAYPTLRTYLGGGGVAIEPLRDELIEVLDWLGWAPPQPEPEPETWSTYDPSKGTTHLWEWCGEMVTKEEYERRAAFAARRQVVLTKMTERSAGR